jgi:lysophospholipase L1-like esterase
LGIRSSLEKYRHIELLNSRSGRQLTELIQVVGNDQSHAPNSIIIFDVGNNNQFNEASFLQLMEIVKNQPQIIVINTAVPRPWRSTNNEIVRNVLPRYPNAVLIDWEVISENHPEYFASDGVHLNPPGANAYVSAILEKLK